MGSSTNWCSVFVFVFGVIRIQKLWCHTQYRWDQPQIGLNNAQQFSSASFAHHKFNILYMALLSLISQYPYMWWRSQPLSIPPTGSDLRAPLSSAPYCPTVESGTDFTKPLLRILTPPTCLPPASDFKPEIQGIIIWKFTNSKRTNYNCPTCQCQAGNYVQEITQPLHMVPLCFLIKSQNQIMRMEQARIAELQS